MPRIAVEIDVRQLEQMINQLKSRDRITLIQRLEHKSWGERFRSLTRKLDKKRKKFPLSRKEVLNLVKQARLERYAAGRS